ncbi:MAG TPA: tRNA lysidine(34) synthetase TilS [Sphingomonas sp.]|nr:tRNA lysidine(34) synthetase TilS [Sphingomonas sp.]
MDAQTSLTASRLARFAAALDALAPAGRIGVAVSGGPDSMALLLLAQAIRPGAVMAATVDHGLRPEAAAEAAMVASVCQTLGVPHATLRVTVADDVAGPQAAARKARYAALGAWAARERIAFLATGHHADDQAETLLMRLARGAGLSGLAGIRRSRPLPEAPGIHLIRPLLDWHKAELEALVAAASIIPARDPSNEDERYDRTRVRTLLRRGWPQSRRIAATARHLAEAEEALAWSARRLAEKKITFTGDAAHIDVAGVPRELRRRLLLTAFAGLKPGNDPRGDSVERLMDTLDRGRAATLGGLKCDPGPPWRITSAAPRRARAKPEHIE